MQSPPDDDKDMKRIFQQNEQWKKEMEAKDPEFFNRLGSTHSPK
jgi:carbonic anhydrase